MTLKQAGERYCVSMEKLTSYAENGLLVCERTTDGSPDYTEQELEKLGVISALRKTGMEMDTLKQYMRLLRQKTASNEEQLRILRGQRYKLLDTIHSKQQALDELDYLIDQLRRA